MLKPDSRFKESWDLLIALLTLFAMVEIPLRLALGYDPRGNGLVLGAEILMTVCFSADLVLNFFIAVPGRDGLVTGRGAVARRYLRGRFLLDLLAAIPFFLLFPPAGPGGFRILKAARILHLTRFLKVTQLTGVFHNWRVRHRLSPGVFRLAYFLTGISLFAHWAACGWVVLSGSRSYVDAIYWTVTTLTTVGYGDITPESGPQKLYTIMVMIAGAGSYGYIIGNFASLLANFDLVRAEQLHKRDQVEAFLKHHAIPPDLHHRVREYYEHLFSSHAVGVQSSICEELPVPLRTEILLHMHRDLLEVVPFFRDAEENFLRAVVPKLQPEVQPPGSRVVEYGDPGDAMFFIDSGTVDILDQDARIIETLSEGDYFGEMALVLGTPRNATVRCRGFCEFFILSRHDFEEVLAQFPEFADDVRTTARERLDLRDDSGGPKGPGDSGRGASDREGPSSPE